MWCCVGSGMENNGKYNQFIYTHRHDSLFLNLFIASELNWEEKGIKIRQETCFPCEEQTTLKITQGNAPFKLCVRYPSWTKSGEFKIFVNGKAVTHSSGPSSYVVIGRKWEKGDVVKVVLPMNIRLEQLPNVPNYFAFMHGPILLGAKTVSEDLRGLVANDSRWGHIAGGEKLPVNKAPVIIEDELSTIDQKLVAIKDKPFTFTAPGLKLANPIAIDFEPFFNIHDSRYMMYWMVLTNAQYEAYLDSLAKMEAEKLELEKRTIDFVAPGEQQPEADHGMLSERSSTGNHLDEFCRDAGNGGYFSYLMATNSETNLSLIVRYCGGEQGPKKFNICIDDSKLISEDNAGRWTPGNFQEVEYIIPDSMVQGKENIRVKFLSHKGTSTSAVYYIRLARKKADANIQGNSINSVLRNSN